MAEKTLASLYWLKDRSELPGRLVLDRVYFLKDEGVFVVDHGAGPVTFGAQKPLNTLEGDETDRSPSVHAVKEAIEEGGGGGPAVEIVDDLTTGGSDKALSANMGVRLKKLIDDGAVTYYRGIFETEAALRAAHPTDTSGAYAVVTATDTMWLYTDDWKDSGKPPESVPGLTPTDAAGIDIEDVTIPATGWERDAGDTSGYSYYYDLVDAELEGDESAQIIPARESLAVVAEAGICPTMDLSAGKVRIYAKKVPTAEITGTIIVFSYGGGSVTTATKSQVDKALDEIGL